MKASECPTTTPGILSLPPHLLESIFMQLEVTERVRVTSTCSHLRHLGLTSTQLWDAVEAIANTVQRAEHYARWLCAGSRARLIKRLCYKVWDSDAPLQAAEVADAMLATLLVKGSALVALLWSPGWLAVLPPAVGQLPQLRLLQIDAPYHQLPRPGEADSFLVPAELSQLSSLTSLRLHYSARFPADAACRPAGLLELDAQLASAVLPAAVRAATRLERLRLEGAVDAFPPLDTSGLDALTRLTFLSLKSANLRNFPPQLTALQSLQCLGLWGNQGMDVSQLTQLAALRELDLSVCGLRALPAGLLAAGRLRALVVNYNEWLGDEVDAPALLGLQSLQALGADMRLANTILESGALTGMTALTHLHLASTGGDMGLGEFDFQRLFQELVSLGRLLRFTFDTEVAGLIGFAPAFEAFARFAQAMPQLVCKHEEGMVMPAEVQCEAWDEVAG